MTKETLDILIGDDLFAMPMQARSIKRSLEPLKEYGMNLTYASTPQEIIREAKKGTYNAIITDLDYGTTGRVGTEGFEILEEIAKIPLNPKPYIILCTSQDTHIETIQQKIAEEKLDVLIGPGSFNKFTTLRDYLTQHYSQQRAPAESVRPLQSEGGEKE